MKGSIVPNHYAAWRHCIEVECGLPLEAGYIRQRIAALENLEDFHTRQFVQRWGEDHRRRVVGWFRQAEEKLHSRRDS